MTAFKTLTMSGRQEGQRFEIRIDGKAVYLTMGSFRYLMALVYGRIVNEGRGGWIDKRDIDEIGENQARYMYRMRKEIDYGYNHLQPLGEEWRPIYANDRTGRYRLCGDLDFEFEWDYLQEFPDRDVGRMAREIRLFLKEQKA